MAKLCNNYDVGLPGFPATAQPLNWITQLKIELNFQSPLIVLIFRICVTVAYAYAYVP